MATRRKSESLMIRMYPDEKEQLALLAREAGCTLTAVIEYALRQVAQEGIRGKVEALR